MNVTKKYSKDELKELPFNDQSLDLEKRVEDLLNRLTLDEKIRLSGGRYDMCTVKKIKRLGVPSFKMTDGPYGVGGVGLMGTRFGKCTYFPVGISRAATWNPELSYKFGEAIAEEVRSYGMHMNLQPAINIHRTPLCGRTFEYQTEDPYLNSRTSVAVVKGVQSKRIAACVKHYAVNNQETRRWTVNAIVDERTLREIYLPAYEAVVREADAWSFMACYNQVNGYFGCENNYLLRDRLMDEWGFRGFVVSDWFAARNTASTEACVNAGLTLEMPTHIKYRPGRIKKALEEGYFTEETFNGNVKRLLRVMFLTGMFDDPETVPKGARSTPEHRAVSREVGEEGPVLLKNENNTLPLDFDKTKTIAVVGPLKNYRFTLKTLDFFTFKWITKGGGSSMIHSYHEITALQGMKNKCGYETKAMKKERKKNKKDEPKPTPKIEIVKDPAVADAAIVVVGLTHVIGQDAEGFDKSDLELPKKHVKTILKTVEKNPNTIVVLITGSPVAMDEWIDKVPAVIELWQCGMDSGNIMADIIFGDVNPSGKLPITFPKKLSDSPAHVSVRTYPGLKNVYYDEGIYVGYRHFDTKNIEPLFPFGYGLSYTTFKYDNLTLSTKQMSGDSKLTVSVDIENTGDRVGKEVVQLYVQDLESSIDRPLKELKGFKKVKIEPGKKETVKLELTKRDLSYYDVIDRAWKAEDGDFKILIGSSSRDIRVEDTFTYKK